MLNQLNPRSEWSSNHLLWEDRWDIQLKKQGISCQPFFLCCVVPKKHTYKHTDKPTTATTKTLRAKNHFLWRIYLDHSFSREPPPTFGLRPRCILQKNMGCESWHGLQHLLLLQVIWDKVRRVRFLKSVKILGKAKCAERCPKCPKINAFFFGLDLENEHWFLPIKTGLYGKLGIALNFSRPFVASQIEGRGTCSLLEFFHWIGVLNGWFHS